MATSGGGGVGLSGGIGSSGLMGMGGGQPPAYNPFGDMPQQKTNLFQQQTQPVSN